MCDKKSRRAQTTSIPGTHAIQSIDLPLQDCRGDGASYKTRGQHHTSREYEENSPMIRKRLDNKHYTPIRCE